MPNERFQITIVAQPDRFKACISYLFQLFDRTYGHSSRVVSPDELSPGTDLYIGYGIDPDGVESKPIIHIGRSSFFGDAFGKHSEPPTGFEAVVEATQGSQFDKLATRHNNIVRIQQDLLAAAFYMLSGYHEWMSTERDSFGRVLSTHVPVPATTWDLPVVNHWMRQLNELIYATVRGQSDAENGRPSLGDVHTVCLTHDVDLLRKYRLGTLPRHLVRSGKAGNFGAELGRAKAVLSGQQRDPYDSFDSLYTVKERISAPSTYFFLGAEPGGKNGDYKVGDREARNLIVRARSFNDEVALHGSWESAENPARLRMEKDAVELAAGKGLVHGSRQHYLRFNNPKSWKGLASAGIRYDSTGGFPDRCGFKYGWSGCFQPFDLEAMAPSPVIEIPLVCMDVTLARYEKIPAELALERLTNLLDAACERVPGGAFVFLWHNTMGDRVTYPGYWDTFEYFFSVASGSARFLTLSQLCDEYEAQQ